MRSKLGPILGVLLAGLLFATIAHGGTAGTTLGKFEVTCKFSNRNQVDPIVSPGQPLSAHLHDFFGNKNVTADSTPDTLRGLSTTCKVADDTAGYWAPTAIRTDTGQLIVPNKVFAYYFGIPNHATEHFPAGLEVVAGDSHATAELGKSVVAFSCGNGGSHHSPVRSYPYDCTAANGVTGTDGVVAIVKFPWCWDGVGLGTADMTYGDPKTGDCPEGFPHVLPQVQQHIHYGNGTAGFQQGSVLSYSSGPYYTLHADWMNAWNQARLDALVDGCTAIHHDCGFLAQ